MGGVKRVLAVRTAFFLMYPLVLKLVRRRQHKVITIKYICQHPCVSLCYHRLWCPVIKYATGKAQNMSNSVKGYVCPRASAIFVFSVVQVTDTVPVFFMISPPFQNIQLHLPAAYS